MKQGTPKHLKAAIECVQRDLEYYQIEVIVITYN